MTRTIRRCADRISYREKEAPERDAADRFWQHQRVKHKQLPGQKRKEAESKARGNTKYGQAERNWPIGVSHERHLLTTALPSLGREYCTLK